MLHSIKLIWTSTNGLKWLDEWLTGVGLISSSRKTPPCRRFVKQGGLPAYPFDLTQYPDSASMVHASTATNVGNATPAAWLWTQRSGVDATLATTEWPGGTTEQPKND